MNAGYCKITQLKDGSLSWTDVWRAHDMLDLQEWVEWEQHVIAEDLHNAGS